MEEKKSHLRDRKTCIKKLAVVIGCDYSPFMLELLVHIIKSVSGLDRL